MTVRLNGDREELKRLLSEQTASGRKIGLVPTMGFLHQGHRSLIEASHRDGFYTVVTIFVNPTQFGPNEDLDSYPRNPEGDFEACRESGADLVWYPEVQDIYVPGSQTRVSPGSLAECLCGLSRPAFFGGICTVVLKFFLLIQPQRAYFGEKDYQQLTIIKQMAGDFFLGVEVVGKPTVREADGLAMSSRNARLKPEQRDTALGFWRAISGAREAYANGERDATALRARLVDQWPHGLAFDYLEFRHPVTLELVETLEPGVRIFLGGWLDGLRLIDNASIT